MKVLLVDNYDSFTYNLHHYIESNPEVECTTVLADKTDFATLLHYDKIVLSPGPGRPDDTPLLHDLLKICCGKVPVLGVCLGHQAIGQFLGFQLVNLAQPVHGIASEIRIMKRKVLFQNLPERFPGARYHSWIIEAATDQHINSVTARDEHDLVMAIEYPEKKLFGVQFHPESVLSEYGKELLKNFMDFS